MNLAIDIGNTSISAALFKNNNLVKKSYFNSIEKFIDFFSSIRGHNIQSCIISSVVPKLTSDYTTLLKENYNLPVINITYKLSNLDLQVPHPETVGSDRLCNIFAVQRDYKIPAIIIDFGTATTYDVINNKKQFIGGVIAAGIETSANYLINKAALLSETDLLFPENAVGVDTQTNIQSGIMFGAVDQVEGMIKRITLETKTDYSVILTGGFSNLISPQLTFSHTVDKDLTLKGVIYIYESNN